MCCCKWVWCVYDVRITVLLKINVFGLRFSTHNFVRHLSFEITNICSVFIYFSHRIFVQHSVRWNSKMLYLLNIAFSRMMVLLYTHIARKLSIHVEWFVFRNLNFTTSLKVFYFCYLYSNVFVTLKYFFINFRLNYGWNYLKRPIFSEIVIFLIFSKNKTFFKRGFLSKCWIVMKCASLLCFGMHSGIFLCLNRNWV